MKKAVLYLAVVSLTAVSLWAQAQPAKTAVPTPIHAMEWMVGGVWTADASKLAPGLTIETRYAWSDNEAYLRFTTHFVSEKGTAKRYDGNFYWDGDAKRLAMWYMDPENMIYQGPITVKADVTTFDFRGEDFEGKVSDLRVNLTKKSNDAYHWQLQEKSGDSWKKLAELDYLRKAGS